MLLLGCVYYSCTTQPCQTRLLFVSCMRMRMGERGRVSGEVSAQKIVWLLSFLGVCMSCRMYRCTYATVLLCTSTLINWSEPRNGIGNATRSGSISTPRQTKHSVQVFNIVGGTCVLRTSTEQRETQSTACDRDRCEMRMHDK